jgi:hypothetical protein
MAELNIDKTESTIDNTKKAIDMERTVAKKTLQERAQSRHAGTRKSTFPKVFNTVKKT